MRAVPRVRKASVAKLLGQAQRRLEAGMRWFGIYIGPFVGALGVYVLARMAVEFLAGVHVLLGGALALAFGMLAVWLARAAKRVRRLVPTTEILAGFLMSVLLAAFVGAWLSYVLHTRGLGAYRVPSAFSLGTFMDLYIFTFIGLVPGLGAWETLKVAAPIEALDWRAGAPLLLFKIFVLWIFFGAVRNWWTHRRGRAAK